jgi:hypothetical protein
MTSVPSSPSPTGRDAASRTNTIAGTPDVIDLRTSRLAELVAGLTGCEPGGALHAVRTAPDTISGDGLEVVARAMVDVDRPLPKELRLAPYLRERNLSERPVAKS